jgi:diaminohydroxyphosphoribosylaminopyrimidine deaminase / 5-amino-6-(5-phosphoribosylamino)uracil reductase
MTVDEREPHMRRALELAARGRGIVSPNPMVGAVLVDASGSVVGEGWHEGPFTPHAESMALREAGERARGATLYCTLEPCAHHGRTPPCTEALIEAGVARVVIAAGDPNPAVDGRGFEALLAAGITVERSAAREEAERLNRAFDRHVVTGLPYVTLKMAASLDGKTAARDGSSKWITGQGARADVQRLRAAADAIVVGAGTVLADDPSLTARDPSYRGAPVRRVVVDGTGRVAADRRIFDDRAPTTVATTADAPEEQLRAWRDAGAEVAVLDRDPAGGVSLLGLMEHLGKTDAQGVLVEGGPSLAWSAIRDGVVDEIVLYLAPSLVGGAGAPGILAGEGFAPVGQAARLDHVRVTNVGPDLKVEADVHRDR